LSIAPTADTLAGITTERDLLGARWKAVYGSRIESVREKLGLAGGFEASHLGAAVLNLMVDALHFSRSTGAPLDLMELAQEAVKIHESEQPPPPRKPPG